MNARILGETFCNLTAFSSVFVLLRSISFAAFDQNTVTLIGVLCAVIATGLSGILTAICKPLLSATKELYQLRAQTDTGRLAECLDREMELKGHLKDVRAASENWKDLALARESEIASLREDKAEQKSEIARLRTDLGVSNERLGKLSMSVAGTNAIVAEKMHPATPPAPSE